MTSGFKWAALFPSQAYCDDLDLRDMTANYILTWDITITPFIQRAGGAGIITAQPFPSFLQYETQAGINTDTGMVQSGLFKFRTSSKYDALASQMVGTKLTIFGGFINWNEDYDPLVEAIQAHIDNNLTFVASHIEDDFDSNVQYREPTSFFYYYNRITVAFCCSVCGGAILQNVYVLFRFHQSDKKGWNWNLVCLIFALIGSVLRFSVFLDPMTLMGLVDFEVYFASTSLSDSFHVFSSFASMIVWFDLIHAVQASIKFRFVTVQLSKSIVFRVGFLATMALLALIDLYCTYAVQIIEDPLGLQDWTYLLFESHQGDSESGEDVTNTGVYTDGFLKFIRLSFLALIEIFVAVRVKQQLYELQHMIEDLQIVTSSAASSIVVAPVNIEMTPIVTSLPNVTNNGSRVVSNSPTTTSSAFRTPSPLPGSVNSLMDSLAVKLSTLSKYMIISGVVMLSASVLLIIQSTDAVWNLSKENPYVLNFFFLSPPLLLQISSIMEVSLVATVMDQQSAKR